MSGFRRWASSLLDQQLWCWGRDITRPEGNVLLGMGFRRHRSTDAKRGSTLYKGVLDGGAEVWLWGFGLLCSQPGLGCVFLRRYGFDPLFAERPPEHPVHSPEHLGPRNRPASGSQSVAVRKLVCGLAEWIAGYEHRVAETFGLDYRAGVLDARDKPPAVPAQAMASGWERLARKAYRLKGEQDVAGPWGRLIASLRVGVDAKESSPAPRPAGRHPHRTDSTVNIQRWRGTRGRGHW